MKVMLLGTGVSSTSFDGIHCSFGGSFPATGEIFSDFVKDIYTCVGLQVNSPEAGKLNRFSSTIADQRSTITTHICLADYMKLQRYPSFNYGVCLSSWYLLWCAQYVTESTYSITVSSTQAKNR